MSSRPISQVTKHTSTFHNVRFAGLSGKALATNHFTNSKSIDIMMSIFLLLWLSHACKAGRQRRRSMKAAPSIVDLRWQIGTIIMTDPATKGHAATGTDNGTLSFIMGTIRTGDFGSSGLLVANGKAFGGTGRLHEIIRVSIPIRYIIGGLIAISIWITSITRAFSSTDT